MTEIITSLTSHSAGGIEVFFSYENANNLAIKLITNLKVLAEFKEPLVDSYYMADIDFSTFESGGESYTRCKLYVNGVVVDQSDCDLQCGMVEKINNRVVFNNTSVSVYTNDLCVYSYTFTDTIWPDPIEVRMSVSGGDVDIDITNVEISDPREAVYIDYESTTDSAIQSIIQQRPIRIFSQVHRANAFTYSKTREAINAHHVFSYDEKTQDNAQLSSDGLVYYVDVGVSLSELTAKEVGLITRLYRFSELDSGALQAAKRVQQIAVEQRKMITVVGRFDPRLQIADRYIIDTIVTSTLRHVVDEIIVEGISIMLSNGNYSMQVVGRRKME
jgi:hypothetical protein